MQAYESRTPAYFATPPVNHIWSLQASLGQILREGMEARWARHAQLSRAFNAGAAALNLTPVPLASELAANTLTALYYPEGIDASLVKSISEQGVIVAGGLHPQIRTRYFRVGHMGAVTGTDILSTLGAIELALHKHGVLKHTGSGVSTALSVLRST
jgi:alanine-glyoxylate transaminase/serine-glyoxylate transaminase/serine-pyruvate transaminase